MDKLAGFCPALEKVADFRFDKIGNSDVSFFFCKQTDFFKWRQAASNIFFLYFACKFFEFECERNYQDRIRFTRSVSSIVFRRLSPNEILEENLTWSNFLSKQILERLMSPSLDINQQDDEATPAQSEFYDRRLSEDSEPAV